jgi:hypothetical protein
MLEEREEGVVTRAYTLASSPAVSSVPLMLSPATAFPEVFVKHLLLSGSSKVIAYVTRLPFVVRCMELVSSSPFC